MKALGSLRCHQCAGPLGRLSRVVGPSAQPVCGPRCAADFEQARPRAESFHLVSAEEIELAGAAPEELVDACRGQSWGAH